MKDHRNVQVESGSVNQGYVSADPDPQRYIYGFTTLLYITTKAFI